MKEGYINPALKKIWGTIRPSLDVDIVNAYEEMHSEFNEEFTKKQIAEGRDVYYYPAFYFRNEPFLEAIYLQTLREMQKKHV